MTLDLTNVQTRDKCRVTLYTTNAPGNFPLQGLIQGEEVPTAWTAEGKQCEGQSHWDLVSPATTKTVVLVMSEFGQVVTYTPEEWANRHNSYMRQDIVTTALVTLERGKFEVPIEGDMINDKVQCLSESCTAVS